MTGIVIFEPETIEPLTDVTTAQQRINAAEALQIDLGCDVLLEIFDLLPNGKLWHDIPRIVTHPDGTREDITEARAALHAHIMIVDFDVWDNIGE